MAKHFTITILLPLIFFLGLASGLTIPENVKNFHKKAEKLVAENPNQFDAYNNMVRSLNAKMNKIRDGQTLKELKSNDTANQLVGEVFKENYQIHNNFVSHLLNLTNKMVGITREEFCRTVPKICDQTYEPPLELKSFLIGSDKENNLKAAQIMINVQPKNSTYFLRFESPDQLHSDSSRASQKTWVNWMIIALFIITNIMFDFGIRGDIF